MLPLVFSLEHFEKRRLFFFLSLFPKGDFGERLFGFLGRYRETFFVILNDSLLLVLVVHRERDPNFVHGFSTFYAILDLHAEFIQYNYSYMLYFANMKCFLYENTCFDVSWDVLFACLLLICDLFCNTSCYVHNLQYQESLCRCRMLPSSLSSPRLLLFNKAKLSIQH